MFWRCNRVFLSAGDFGGSGGGDQNPDNPTPPEEPAYFSQFSKESKERFKPLAKFRNINELGEAALRGLDMDNPALVKIPGKDSTKEEIRAYLTKIGVPESADDYIIPDDNTTPFAEALRTVFRKAAFENGLSSKQTTAVWGIVKAAQDSVATALLKEAEKKKSGFASSFDKLFEEAYPDKSKRDLAVSDIQNHANAFISDTGIAEKLEESGLAYDPEFMKAIGEYAKSHHGKFQSGNPRGGSSSGGIKYSDDFMREYGSN